MRKTYSLSLYPLIIILLLAYAHLGYCQTYDSLSAVSKSLVNPFKNLKASVFTQIQAGSFLGTGYLGGLEVRRFISLKKYIFIDGMYGAWNNNHKYAATNSSYKLHCESYGAKFGLGIFGTQSIMAGAHYIIRAHLSETIPSPSNADESIIESGSIINYTKNWVPFVGWNTKFKLWKFIFLEVGAEAWFRQTAFKPLKDHWRVPQQNSPFLSNSLKSGVAYYTSIHFKL